MIKCICNYFRIQKKVIGHYLWPIMVYEYESADDISTLIFGVWSTGLVSGGNIFWDQGVLQSDF